MTLILEDVISEAKKKYKLNVREDNKPKYLEFLQKQIELHGYDLDKTNDGKNKKLIHRDLLVDEMYLYACLIREQPVMWIEFGGRIRLKEDKDLNL